MALCCPIIYNAIILERHRHQSPFAFTDSVTRKRTPLSCMRALVLAGEGTSSLCSCPASGSSYLCPPFSLHPSETCGLGISWYSDWQDRSLGAKVQPCTSVFRRHWASKERTLTIRSIRSSHGAFHVRLILKWHDTFQKIH